ncbi:hypothetical protein [Priestia aryabhattai]|uniref:hypothetical protein n=1 Tax=Priestia aryabhattai TaxID=412384 RepID=UPI0015F3A48D|nr:hypothetical protein [Priestia aryabhattai]MED3887886.1 hypothetical protein [Priestia aryabhattai]MED4261475.1 hypothetical protein [Priestia aryabhattai]
MLTMIGTGAVFFTMIFAEKKGWLDVEKAKTIINIGMMSGICIALLYFVHILSKMF